MLVGTAAHAARLQKRGTFRYAAVLRIDQVLRLLRVLLVLRVSWVLRML